MNKTAAGILLAFAFFTAAGHAAAESSPADPYERYNRFMYRVNDQADRYVLAPVARGYRKVTPKPVRLGIGNFFNNLGDVVSFGSNLLRLDIKRASEDLVRVGVNTVFGLGGLINIADAGRMPDNKNTPGDTFASWGWKNSNYLVLPLLGPSTVRDGIATAVTTSYPVKSAIFSTAAGRWSSTALSAVNSREKLLDLTDSLDDAALDKYAYTRDIYMTMRAKQTGGSVPAGSAEEDIDIDELVGSDASAAQSGTGSPETGSPAQSEAAPAAASEPVIRQ